ncbi:MAG TPA: ABC transporter family substrate-binding protein [Acidimicrobiales bacterium]|nr:ABC transporter family substrate-binding protein [Acidimicrobiales bacterium]
MARFRRRHALFYAGASIVAAGSMIGGLAATTAGASKPVAHASSGKSVSVALDEQIAGFNVLTSADNNFDLAQIINNVWPETFLTTNKLNLVMNSQLLDSATQTSTSPQTIVYKINPKATWSDGVPITAADFIYNWHAQSGLKKYTDKGGKPYDVASSAGYNQISSITGSNGGKTVTVKFSTPFADWKSLFGPMVPAHIAEKVGWNTGFNSYKNAISGSWYTIASYKTNQFLVLKANPKYWGKAPGLKTVTFTWVSTDDSEPTGLQNGELQVINPASVSQSLVAQANKIPGTVHQVVPGLEFEHFDFNEANPYLAHLDVRKAIAYGTNRKQIIADTVGAIAPKTVPLGNRMLMPNQPGYVNNGAAYDTVNVAKAKSLLSSSGFKMGSDGYFHPTFGPEAGQDFTLNIETTSGNPVRAETVQLFQAQMQQIGIKIIPVFKDAATFFGTDLPSGQFDIGEFAWVSTPFLSGNQSIYCSYTLGSQCGSNWNHFANASVTELMQAGSTATHPAAEIADYNKADALLWKNMVTLPLYQKPQYFAWTNKLHNVLPNPSSVGVTWNLFDWRTAA